MDNVEITEERLEKTGWKKVGNTFYRSGKAVTHFEGKFQVWSGGEYRVIKSMQEIHFFTEEKETKKA